MAPLIFKVLVIGCGLIAMVTGANDAWRGASVKGDFGDLGDHVNAPMLNFTLRYLGTMWMGLGVLMILFATNLKQYDLPLMVTFGIVILGGFSRVLSIVKTGMPQAYASTVYSILAVELVLVPSLLVWLIVATDQLKGT